MNHFVYISMCVCLLFLTACMQPIEYAQFRIQIEEIATCHTQFVREVQMQFLTDTYNDVLNTELSRYCLTHIEKYEHLADSDTLKGFANLDKFNLQVAIQKQDILLLQALLAQKEKVNPNQKLYLSGCAFSVKICVFEETITSLQLNESLTQTLSE